MFLVVDLGDFFGKAGGVAAAKLLDGVDSGGLEQLGELRAYAGDAEQVGMIEPFEASPMPSMSIIAYFIVQ